ncbi:hypothetical protein ACC705_34820, partial [Rhizobium ruizarguesonis]
MYGMDCMEGILDLVMGVDGGLLGGVGECGGVGDGWGLTRIGVDGGWTARAEAMAALGVFKWVFAPHLTRRFQLYPH